MRSTVKEFGSVEKLKEMKSNTESMLETVRKLENEAEVKANKVDDVFHEIQSKSAQLEKTIEKQSEIESQFKDVKKKVDDLSVHYEDLPSADELKEARDKYKETTEELESAVPALEQAFNHIDDASDDHILMRSDIDKVKEELKAEMKDGTMMQKLEKKLAEIEQSQDQLAKSINNTDQELLTKIKRNQEKIEFIQEEVEKAQVDEAVDESQLEKEIEEIKSKINMETDPEEQEAQNRLEVIEKNQELIGEKVNNMDSIEEKLDKHDERIQNVKEEVKHHSEANIGKIENQLSDLRTVYSTLKNQMSDVEVDKSDYATEEDFEQLQEEVEEISSALVKLSQELYNNTSGQPPNIQGTEIDTKQ